MEQLDSSKLFLGLFPVTASNLEIATEISKFDLHPAQTGSGRRKASPQHKGGLKCLSGELRTATCSPSRLVGQVRALMKQAPESLQSSMDLVVIGK